jgi:hypothetical protein
VLEVEVPNKLGKLECEIESASPLNAPPNAFMTGIASLAIGLPIAPIKVFQPDVRLSNA